jgi:hypothetical protein
MNANPTEHRMGDEPGGGGSEPLRPGYVRPVTSPTVRTSQLHFDVNPTVPEIVAYARNRSWAAHGYAVVSITWQELHWTTDGWKTVNKVSSNDVPCPITNGWFAVPVKPGTQVEFALHVGLQCRAPQDTAGAREIGDLWFNDAGKNYTQRTR